MLRKSNAFCVLYKRACNTKVPNSHAEATEVTPKVGGVEKLLNDENEPTKRERVEPNDMSIVLFPGQGTQYVGMAKRLLHFPKVKDLFHLANEVLNYNILKIMIDGPAEKLNRTEHAQPAVMLASLAALEQLREERPQAIENCVATAGFSLGELTSLTFAGALPFDKALKLVQVRATAMQAACDTVESGMALVLYGPDTKIRTACFKATQWCLDLGIEAPYCNVANYMYPHCKVLAGHNKALEFLEKNMKALKIKRIKRLPVSGAFHTPLMESAVGPFTRALKNTPVMTPIIRVYSNVNGKPYTNANQIVHQLPKQIVKSVKWEQTMHEMFARQQGETFPRVFECGPGKGLLQVLDKVNAKATQNAHNVEA